MRIMVMSDLHFEFDGDSYKQQINMLDPTGVDVLVLAGDICTISQFSDVMISVCKRFEDANVIWVHGNHEYYGSCREDVERATLAVVKQNKNLHWLNKSSITISGQRFVGATMWFEEDERSVLFERNMYDFSVIQDLKSWVYKENADAKQYFHDTIKCDDVVITHHLPSKKSIAKFYENSELNRFFVCDMSGLIEKVKPKLWLHGHTHATMNYEYEQGGTKIACNPRGYYPYDLNPEFSDAFIITI